MYLTTDGEGYTYLVSFINGLMEECELGESCTLPVVPRFEGSEFSELNVDFALYSTDTQVQLVNAGYAPAVDLNPRNRKRRRDRH